MTELKQEGIRNQTLLRASKDSRLWRTLNANVLKGHCINNYAGTHIHNTQKKKNRKNLKSLSKASLKNTLLMANGTFTKKKILKN